MTTPANQLPDLEFRRSTASSIRDAASHGNAEKFQRAMIRQHRTAGKRLEKSLPAAASSILWSADQPARSGGDRELAALLGGSKKQQKAAGKLAIESVVRGEHQPLAVLTAVDQLIRRGEQLPPDTYTTLYVALAAIAEVAPEDSEDDCEELVVRLICDGEIPYILSLVLSDLKGRARQGREAAAVLREGLDAATDTDGFVHARLAGTLDAWLAPFVRAAAWSDAFDNSWMKAKDSARFADAARHCATLLTPNGLVSRPPVELRICETRTSEVVERGLRLAGLRNRSPFVSLAAVCANGSRRSARSAQNKKSGKIEVSNQSDWAEAAVLRSGLRSDSDVGLVTWDTAEPQLHLAVLGTPLLSGNWSSDVVINGTSTGPVTDWSCSCWFHDDEAAFLELEADPAEGVHLVRHLMLSLKERVAVVCESVTCDPPDAEVRLTQRLPLTANPLAVTNSITREVVLHADCVSTRVVPAWLEDDRIQHTTGRCEKQDDWLVSVAEGVGGATVPVVLDWHPERQAQDADWNRLTVTEKRQVSTAGEASGFRVRIGRLQLLIYRSLKAGAAPRAVLGEHTFNETLYGRVRKSGEIAPLVIVDETE